MAGDCHTGAPHSGSRNAAPIGVFDSGLGGLTVLRAIRERVPSENLVFLGDTARVPYGARSPQTVIRYARNCTRRLREREVKILVIACNTASAVAIDVLRTELEIPVLGVIEPGARTGLQASRTGRIGVIGTTGTIESGAYAKAISSMSPGAVVVSNAAPLLVPLVEEGWVNGVVPEMVIRSYLRPLADSGIDVLILGCTHYPVLKHVVVTELDRMCPDPVSVVDSAAATAQELEAFLRRRRLANPSEAEGSIKVMVTDNVFRFGQAARRYLGTTWPIGAVEQIDIL